jgi:hypothetical protein
MTALVLGALIAAIAVLLVALPFLRRRGDDDDRIDQPTEAEERRLLLIDERDHALAALKELEFDHRTGAIDDTDYRELVGPLRRAAADALRALDAYLPADHPRARRQAPPPLPEPAPAPLPPEPVEAAKEPED